MTQPIFLSYASQDADTARRICDALRAAGLEVWFDQSELRGGDAWDASIKKQIKECALFIPLITPNTQAREEGYFRLEWKLAVDRSHLMADNKAFFVPVLIGDVNEPAALVPDKFRERQWSRLHDAASMAEFAARVAKLVSGSGSQAKSAPEAAPVLDFGKSAPVANKAGDTPSIAVLAFANRSASAEDEYFSDGLADELLNVLAKIKSLRVVARTSSFAFKGKSDDVATIGAKLNVATLLEGSVRKSGNRARISVQLVRVSDSAHLWSETYDRTLDDIFAVQDDIAQAVVTELRSALMGGKPNQADEMNVTAEIARAARDRSDNSEAQRLFLQGRYLLGRKSETELMRSIDYFKQAVELDPHFALAWAWLAQAYCDAGGWGTSPLHQAYADANAAASLALALAPDMVQAHTAMASFQIGYQWDWAKANATIQRALQLAPGNAEVLTVATKLAFCLNRLAEAEAYGLNAVAVDPLNAGSYRMLAMVGFAAGKLDDAVLHMRHSLALAPEAVASRHVMSNILAAQGRLDEALAEAMLEKAEWARLTSVTSINWAMNTVVSRTESDNALAQLVDRHAGHSAIQISASYAMRGDADAAFMWLERAYAQRDGGTVYIKALPFHNAVKGDARYLPFLRKMGLES